MFQNSPPFGVSHAPETPAVSVTIAVPDAVELLLDEAVDFELDDMELDDEEIELLVEDALFVTFIVKLMG